MLGHTGSLFTKNEIFSRENLLCTKALSNSTIQKLRCNSVGASCVVYAACATIYIISWRLMYTYNTF